MLSMHFWSFGSYSGAVILIFVFLSVMAAAPFMKIYVKMLVPYSGFNKNKTLSENSNRVLS